MKKFTVQCNFGGQKSPFTIYIGNPKEENHPVHFQSQWLSSERGGNIPTEVMEGLVKIRDIAKKNGVDFEELCAYALQAAMVTNQEPDKVLQNQQQSQQPAQPQEQSAPPQETAPTTQPAPAQPTDQQPPQSPEN